MSQEVVVTNIRMSFGAMVVLMVKAAFASIPAAIIVAFIWLVFSGVVGGLLRSGVN